MKQNQRITFTFARGDVRDAVYALALRRRCDAQAVINDVLARALFDKVEERLADELRLVSQALEFVNRQATGSRGDGMGGAEQIPPPPLPPVSLPVANGNGRKRNPWEE